MQFMARSFFKFKAGILLFIGNSLYLEGTLHDGACSLILFLINSHGIFKSFFHNRV